ncbi:unnamed protein product [Discula destructiva]
MQHTNNFRDSFVCGTIVLNVATYFQWSLPYTLPTATSPRLATHLDRHALVALAQGIPKYMLDHFTLSLYNLRCGRYWTLLTSAFSHQDLPHLASNMYGFWSAAVTGFDLGLGALHMTALSLGSAVAGSLSWLWYTSVREGSRHSVHHYGVGASGMVYGMLVGTMLCDLHRRVVVAPDVTLPQWAVTGSYFAWDLLSMLRRGGGVKAGIMAGKEVGHAAHVGAAVFGAAYWYLFLRPTPWARRPRTLGGCRSRRGRFGGPDRRY